MGTKGTIARLTGAYDQWNNALGQQYDTAKSSYTPFQASGTNALARLQDPTANFQASPGYDYRLKQGLGAVTQTKAAQGLLRSGAYGEALMKTGQDYGSNEFGNWWNQQAGLAGMGYTATNALAGLGMDYADAVGQNSVNLQERITDTKQRAQARTNSLIGGLVGPALNFATGGMSSGLSGLWGSIGGGGATKMASAALPGVGGYNFGMA